MKANNRLQGTRHKVSGPLSRDVRHIIERIQNDYVIVTRS